MQTQPGVIVAYTSLAVALISALVSIRVAILNQRANRELEKLKSSLAEGAAERNARRDYEYEARKRLYTELEPLLFRLVDASDEAWHRILSMARSVRRREIREDGMGWLEFPNGYYFRSTMYKLLVPMAVVRLFEEKLTFVDLTVEPRLRDQYYLAKAADRSFTDDFPLAQADPKLDYEPNDPNAARLQVQQPEVYRRQGLYIGGVDIAAAALILRPADASPRIMTFGEFSQALKNSATRNAFKDVVELFEHFHPKTRPVLWRLLIAQATIYKTFVSLRSLSREAAFEPRRKLRDKELDLLAWKSETADDELKKLAAIAYEHIGGTFRRLAGL